jgi:hypothetical protein
MRRFIVALFSLAALLATLELRADSACPAPSLAHEDRIVQSYTNPQGTSFKPIRDTTTFANCAAGATAGARPYGGSAGAPLLPPNVTKSFDASATGPCVAN